MWVRQFNIFYHSATIQYILPQCYNTIYYIWVPQYYIFYLSATIQYILPEFHNTIYSTWGLQYFQGWVPPAHGTSAAGWGCGTQRYCSPGILWKNILQQTRGKQINIEYFLLLFFSSSNIFLAYFLILTSFAGCACLGITIAMLKNIMKERQLVR